MADEVGRCPACKQTLRLARPIKADCVTTRCPACGAELVIVLGDASMELLVPSEAVNQRFRRLMSETKMDAMLSAGSAAGLPGAGVLALLATGQLLVAGIVAVGAIAAAGLGLLPVAYDARQGASTWFAWLPREDDVLVLHALGYRV